MDLLVSNQSTTSTVYTGPLGDDPLTENELAVLLAIPRGSERAPNATIFRLPLGPEPSHGWVDVTFSEARAIITRLAIEWKDRLSNGIKGQDVGPGMTICLLVQPMAHVLFHRLAFWALGCTIQLVSLSLGDDTITSFLNQTGCQVAIYSGIDDTRAEIICSGCDTTMMRLTEGEYAHQLALSHKQVQLDLTLPWPEPRRPNPAIILHSSGSTGVVKLLRFSLHFYTFDPPDGASISNNVSDHRPYLMLSAPHWQSFNMAFIVRLVVGNSMAFAHVHDITKLPSSKFIGWAQGLGAGAVACPPRFIRDTLASGSESNIRFLQGMNNIYVSGSTLDETTAALAEKYKLRLTNVLGCTELGGVLSTSQPPYTHLHIAPGTSPIVLPISDAEPDGSRQVQFWYPRSTSLQIAHLHATGGVPLQLEPFPGEGTHKGELAVKWDDIFKEVQGSTSTGSQPSYIPLGRSDDLIKFPGGSHNMNASLYEIELTSVIVSYLARESDGTSRWTIDGVQLFGNGRPCTALVIQLRPVDRGDAKGEVGREILEHLSDLVEHVNNKLKLDPHQRVHPKKRMIIITSDGKAYGPGIPGVGEDVPRLTMTHKHTLQRWRNVEQFSTWLDGLDYSET